MTDHKRCAQLERQLERLINVATEVVENPNDDTYLATLYDEIRAAEEILAAPHLEETRR